MSVTMTKELIYKYSLGEKTNAINSSQCIILGFEFKELKRGWIHKVKGKVISSASFELFKRLKGIRGKKNQLRVIDNFKSKKTVSDNKLFVVKRKDIK